MKYTEVILMMNMIHYSMLLNIRRHHPINFITGHGIMTPESTIERSILLRSSISGILPKMALYLLLCQQNIKLLNKT